jgi:hypothetical protein
MFHGTANHIAIGERRVSAAGDRQLTRTRLINRGRDTKLTFGDGSILVLRGVSQIDAVFPESDAAKSH